MTDPIRLDEVLAELSRLEREFDGGPKGFTCVELAARLGVGMGAAQGRLRAMFGAGKIELAGKRRQLNIAGIPCRVPVYRLADPKMGSCDPDKGSCPNP